MYFVISILCIGLYIFVPNLPIELLIVSGLFAIADAIEGSAKKT